MGRRRKEPDENGRWRCSVCEEYRRADQFYKAKNTSNGLMSRCIRCMKVTQIAIALKNKEPFSWDFFPLATDDELDEFSVVLLDWYTMPKYRREYQRTKKTLQDWLRRFERQEEETAGIFVPDGRRTELPRTTPGTTAKVGDYEVQLLGPPVEAVKPSWWDKHPMDMDQDEFTEWMVSKTDSDPAKRSL